MRKCFERNLTGSGCCAIRCNGAWILAAIDFYNTVKVGDTIVSNSEMSGELVLDFDKEGFPDVGGLGRPLPCGWRKKE